MLVQRVGPSGLNPCDIDPRKLVCVCVYVYCNSEANLRVQVRNNHMLSQILSFRTTIDYPKPKYLIIGSLGPLKPYIRAMVEGFEVQDLENLKTPAEICWDSMHQIFPRPPPSPISRRVLSLDPGKP